MSESIGKQQDRQSEILKIEIYPCGFYPAIAYIIKVYNGSMALIAPFFRLNSKNILKNLFD